MKVSFGTFEGRFDLAQKIGHQFLLYETLYANHLKNSKLLKKSRNKEKPKALMGRRPGIPSLLQIHRKQISSCFETDKFI